MSQFGTGLLVLLGILAAPACLLVGFSTLGVWGAILAAPLFYLGIIPFLDLCVSLGLEVPELPHFECLPRSTRRSLLLSASVFHIAFLVLFIFLWQTAAPQPVESFLLMLSFGWVQAGSGLVLAHELIHERSKLFRLLGLATFSSLGQAQQYWFHVQSHHRLAGTIRDASTAPAGVSFFGYLARQPFAMFRLAICDLDRSEKFKRSLLLLTLNVLPTVFLALAFSVESAFWYFISNLVVELTFECFNYVTHYGCMGKRIPTAWSCHFYFSNWTTLGLSNHIEHHGGHKPGTKEYSLPYNIHYMMILSLMPGLFMHVTHGKIHGKDPVVRHA